VLEHVGEGLLDDAVDGKADVLGHLADRPLPEHGDRKTDATSPFG